ncbi:MAG: hypothetical protein ABIL23_07705, partial [candidate division WOR-3 bacterium]
DRGFIHIRIGNGLNGKVSAKEIISKITKELGGGGGGSDVKAEGKIKDVKGLEKVLKGVI